MFDNDAFREAAEEYFKNPWKYAEEHRRNISDLEWANMQPDGPPNYDFGDVVEFKAGGFGRIDAISYPHGGWPSSYSTMKVKGLPCHPTTKCAWHYEGDFLKLKEKASKELSEIMAEMKGQSDNRMAAYAMRDLNTDNPTR